MGMMNAITGVIAASGKRLYVKYIDVYSTPGSYIWQKKDDVKFAQIILYGGGGGGGSGSLAGLGSGFIGGGGGGRGGSIISTDKIANNLLKSTGTVVVGAGGAGGTATTVNPSNGFDGSYGSSTYCSLLLDGSVLSTDNAPPGQGGRLDANFVAAGGGTSGIDSGYGGAGGASTIFSPYTTATLNGLNGGNPTNTWPFNPYSITQIKNNVGIGTRVTNTNWGSFMNDFAICNTNYEFKQNIFYTFEGTFNVPSNVSLYPEFGIWVDAAADNYVEVFINDTFVMTATNYTSSTRQIISSLSLKNGTNTIFCNVMNYNPNYLPINATNAFAVKISSYIYFAELFSTRQNTCTQISNTFAVTSKMYQSGGGGGGGSANAGPVIVDYGSAGKSGVATYVSSTFYASNLNGTLGVKLIKGLNTSTNIYFASGGNGAAALRTIPAGVADSGHWPGGGGGGGRAGQGSSVWGGTVGGKGGDGAVIIISYT